MLLIRTFESEQIVNAFITRFPFIEANKWYQLR
jgi:hypothetical protein